MTFKKFIKAAGALASAAALGLCPLLSACQSGEGRIKLTIGMVKGSTEEEKQFFDECERAFEELYPEYDVVSEPYVYDSNTVVAKFASGKLPAVFEADASLVREAYLNGYIKDVREYLDEYGWLEKTDSRFLTEISVGTAVCGVPAKQYAAGMVLNLPLLFEAGVIETDGDGNYVLYSDGEALYPDTFDEVADAARRVAAAGDGTGAIFLSSGDESCGKIFLEMVYNFGSGGLEYTDAEGNWQLSLTHDEFGDAMRWVRQMAQERLIADAYAGGTEGWASEMAAGRVAIAFCQNDQLMAALAAEPTLSDSIAFVPMPAAEDKATFSSWNGTVYAISSLASDEQTEGIFRFLQFMGKGAQADEHSEYISEMRMKIRYDGGIPVLPEISAWNDEGYVDMMNRLYNKYVNVNEQYFEEFYIRFGSVELIAEPYARSHLYSLMDELFSKMLYEATTSNIVTLTEEGERAFSEKYLAGIAAD